MRVVRCNMQNGILCRQVLLRTQQLAMKTNISADNKAKKKRKDPNNTKQKKKSKAEPSISEPKAANPETEAETNEPAEGDTGGKEQKQSKGSKRKNGITKGKSRTFQKAKSKTLRRAKSRVERQEKFKKVSKAGRSKHQAQYTTGDQLTPQPMVPKKNKAGLVKLFGCLEPFFIQQSL